MQFSVAGSLHFTTTGDDCAQSQEIYICRKLEPVSLYMTSQSILQVFQFLQNPTTSITDRRMDKHDFDIGGALRSARKSE
jgi:hypothetical protein